MEDVFGLARALFDGDAGDDTLISRGGRDVLNGGNDISFNTCADNLAGGQRDAANNDNCGPYNAYPESCGVFDNGEWTASV